MRKTEVGALPNSPLLMMAILIVMAIAVVVVIAMTLKLNQEVRNLAEDVEIDRQNLAKLNHEVGKRLGAPRPRGQQRPSGAGVPQQGRPQTAAQQAVRTTGNPATTPAPANAEVVSPSFAAGMPAEAAQGYVPGSYRVPVRGAEGPSAAAASARETARAEAAQSPRAAQTMPRQSTLAERRAERRVRAERRAAMADYTPARAERRANIDVPRGEEKGSWPGETGPQSRVRTQAAAARETSPQASRSVRNAAAQARSAQGSPSRASSPQEASASRVSPDGACAGEGVPVRGRHGAEASRVAQRQRADREAQRAALEAQRLVEQQRAARAQREDEIRRRAERQAARAMAEKEQNPLARIKEVE